MEKEKALVIGDLHVSDVYSGRHVNYWENCMDILSRITDTIKTEGIQHLYLLGDLVGIREKNLKQRANLLAFIQILTEWNTLTNGNVYAVRGNHDTSNSLSDYDMFLALGLIKNLDYVDMGDVRFHMVDWGSERRKLTIADDSYNIALMHNNIQVEGLTTWFRAGEGIELSSLDNLYGVQLVLAGDIHDPSIKLVSTSIRDIEVSLFYPGCLTRPKFDKNIWDTAFGIIVESSPYGVAYNQLNYKLKPASELFRQTLDDVDDVDLDLDTDEPIINIVELTKILEELQNYNLNNGDIRTQITRLAGLDKDAATLALSYIDKIEEELG